MKSLKMQCIIEGMKNSSKCAQKGSALFLILIGVALFAALGYAVSNMMKGGSTTNINDEKARIYAGEILDYGRTMRQTVQNLRISNRCRDTDISFENQIESGYVNGTNTQCQVFHSDGGGMSYIPPNGQWLDQNASSNNLFGELFFTGETCINGLGTDNAASDCRDFTSDYAELFLIMPYLKEDVCFAIAEISEVLRPDNTIPIDYQRAWPDADPKFTGSYSSENILSNNNGGDSSQTLEGTTKGCFEAGGVNPASDTYHFYQVLIAR
ncbi:MAG: hypothetical protein AB8B83_05945 [Bdellovibrionales bacterium]